MCILIYTHESQHNYTRIRRLASLGRLWTHAFLLYPVQEGVSTVLYPFTIRLYRNRLQLLTC